jgi:hypothetical protein
MFRTLTGSLVGTAAGFVIGYVAIFSILRAVYGIQSDTVPFCLFVGIFLAGAGAIAGAVTGGIADLRAHSRRTQRAAK